MNQNKNYRMTHQREMILEVVRESHTHLTADEIYERARKKLPRISMGTVYRNLDILASCGFIKKLQPGYTQMRFDGNTRDHYHVVCMRCGKIGDAPIEPSDNTIQNLENVLGKLTRYGIFGHNLEFLGLCPNCMERERDLPENEQINQIMMEVKDDGTQGESN